MSTHGREKNYSIGLRFKEEREKKSVSQSALSDLLYISRKTIVNWEGEASFPDAKQLALMGSELGFDIYYIITGSRLPPFVTQDVAAYKSDTAQLLLQALSIADETGRNALLSVAQLITQA
jgi:transcriptional regulator with XRE-family HTH domain